MRKAMVLVVLSLAVSARADIGGVTSHDISVPSSQANPEFMVVGPDGNVWFTDTAHKLVGKMVISGNSATVTTFPLQTVVPAGQGTLDQVEGIAVGPDNALWFTFRGCTTSPCGALGRQQNLGRITTDGSLSAVALQGVPNPGFAQGAPSSIVAGPDGNFWMVYGTSTILRVTTAGAVTPLSPPKGDVIAITVGPDHNIWYLGRSVVGKVTTSGVFTEFALPSGSNASTNLVFDSNGNLWFNGGNQQMLKMTQSGSFTAYPLPVDSYPGWLVAFADGTIWYTRYFDPVIARISTSTGQVDEQRLSGVFGKGRQLLVLPAAVSGSSIHALANATTTLLRNGSDQSGGPNLTRIDVPGSATGDPDLTVTLDHMLYPKAVGRDTPGVRYTMIVKNVGAAPTKGTWAVEDQLPPELEITERGSTGCKRPDPTNPNRLVCEINEAIAPGQTYMTGLVVNIRDSKATIKNQVRVTGGGDKNLTNNDSNVDELTASGELLVSKYHFEEKGNLIWVMHVFNNSDSPKSTIVLQDRLPDGVTLDGIDIENSNPLVSCRAEGALVTCSIDSLQPVQSVFIRLVVHGYPEGKINTATATMAGQVVQSRPDVVEPRRATPVANPNVQPTNGGH